MVSHIIIGLIGLYQKTISPDHGFLARLSLFGVCRYQPTCSEYAKQSIARFGSVRGIILAARRVARCHPFGKFGYDPVPRKFYWRSAK